MQHQYRQVFISALLLVALLLSSIPLFYSPQPVQAADPGAWVLRDAQWVLSGSDANAKIFQSGLSDMKVNVASGFMVSCDHTGTGSGENEGIGFNQKITVTMRGTYSAASGMSGTYTFANDGTMTAKGKQSPWSGTHSGTFTGPVGIAEGQSYVISFSGGRGTITGIGGSGEATYHPFQLRFTVGKGEADSGAVFSSLSGTVQIRPDIDKRGWRVPALKQAGLLPYGTHIKTGANSSATISLPNGDTFVLGPDSEIMIDFPSDKKSNYRFPIGGLKATIQRIIQDESLEIDMDYADIVIEGTTFICEQTATQSAVKVIEGTVAVKSKVNGQKINVTTGNMVTATSAGLGQLTPFDVSQEQAKWQSTGTSSSSSSPIQGDSTDDPHITIGAGRYEIKISPPKCFIATAAYGSETAQELDTLRSFRDKVLLQNRLGRLFVYAYYTCSPPAAEFIARHETIRTLVRIVLLDPVVFLLDKSQDAWNN
jgi:hypothetical protein